MNYCFAYVFLINIILMIWVYRINVHRHGTSTKISEAMTDQQASLSSAPLDGNSSIDLLRPPPPPTHKHPYLCIYKTGSVFISADIEPLGPTVPFHLHVVKKFNNSWRKWHFRLTWHKYYGEKTMLKWILYNLTLLIVRSILALKVVGVAAVLK